MHGGRTRLKQELEKQKLEVERRREEMELQKQREMRELMQSQNMAIPQQPTPAQSNGGIPAVDVPHTILEVRVAREGQVCLQE